MKQLRNYSIIIMILSVTSCSRQIEEPNNLQENRSVVMTARNIQYDTAFKELIKAQLSFYKRIVNPEGIREILKDNKITPTEYTIVPSYFGYANSAEFERYFLVLKTRAKYLDDNYGWKSLTQDEQQGILLEGFKKALGLSWGAMELSLLADKCDEARINCISDVASRVAVMHLACAAADLTLIAGIVCHGVVTVYHMVEGNKCNDEYSKCKKPTIN